MRVEVVNGGSFWIITTSESLSTGSTKLLVPSAPHQPNVPGLLGLLDGAPAIRTSLKNA